MKKLLSDFYQVVKTNIAGDKAVFEILINPEHPVFEGHFPGQPVVPGVCMMQMVKELTEEALSCRLRFATVQDMKFLVVIAPVKNNCVQVTLNHSRNEDLEQVNAQISNADVIHFKFRGNFIRQ